jgi:hypothetical protein
MVAVLLTAARTKFKVVVELATTSRYPRKIVGAIAARAISLAKYGVFPGYKPPEVMAVPATAR